MHQTFAFILGAATLLHGCGKAAEPEDIQEAQTITTLGGTCGSWFTTINESTGQKVIVVADCGPGLYCMSGLWKGHPPTDGHGRQFGTCLPLGSSPCGPNLECPPLLGCVTGYGTSAGGICVLGCQTTGICPDEFQICDGSCQFVACPLPDENADYPACPQGSHCQDGSCRGSQ